MPIETGPSLVSAVRTGTKGQAIAVRPQSPPGPREATPSVPGRRSRRPIDAASARYAVLGAGRLGSSLALALSEAGASVVAHTERTDEGRRRATALLGLQASRSIGALVHDAFTQTSDIADGQGADETPVVFLLTVPDTALTEAAAELTRAVLDSPHSSSPWVVAHTSGATPVAVLDACADAGAVTLSFHPLQTFSDPARGPSQLRGATVAVTPGTDPTRADEARMFGERLASLVGGSPFLLAEEHRALYHAAATVASNYLVALEHAAERLFEAAGMPKEGALGAFMPLIRGAVDNLETQGTVRALTGPMSRGDLGTILAHIAALEAQAPELVGLYRALGAETLRIVRTRGDLPPSTIETLENTMDMTDERTTDSVTGKVTIVHRTIAFPTQGEGDVIDLTHHLGRLLRETGLTSGTVTVFAPGATGAVTTLEFEPGVVHDFKQLFARIIPADDPYRHNLLLSDGNGHSHVRAGLLGPSLVIPFHEARLALGTWQEAVFVCFDNRPRERTVIVQIMGVTD